MPQLPVAGNSRMSLRIASEEKSLLLRAVALKRTNLTDFVVKSAVEAARLVVEQDQTLRLTEQDSLLVLDLLENPPAPNEKLLAAATALPDRA